MKKSKTTARFLTLIALVISITFSSCSSNDDDVTDGEELSEIVMKDFVENFQKMAVPAGLSSSNNQYAQQANAQFETLKSLGSSFTALFVVPANAISSKSPSKSSVSSEVLNTKTYTWSSNGTTVKYTITDESDRFTFTYTITSSSFTGKFMDGYQLKDGSYAQVNLYDDNQVVSTIKWWVTAETTKIELDSDGYRIVLESNNTDNSGTLKVYEGSFYAALYSWNANGSGSYTDFSSNQTYTWQ